MKEALFPRVQLKKRKLYWRGEAICDENWKWSKGPDGGLFDLATDLGEQKNISA
jgi:hypothetical protein